MPRSPSWQEAGPLWAVWKNCGLPLGGLAGLANDRPPSGQAARERGIPVPVALCVAGSRVPPNRERGPSVPSWCRVPQHPACVIRSPSGPCAREPPPLAYSFDSCKQLPGSEPVAQVAESPLRGPVPNPRGGYFLEATPQG